MKALIILVCFNFVVITLFSQDAYEVSWAVEEFVPFDDGESLFDLFGFSFGEGDDICHSDFGFPRWIDIGFDFPYFHEVYEEAGVGNMGWVVFDYTTPFKYILTWFVFSEDINCPDGPLESDLQVQRGILDGLRYCAIEMSNGKIHGHIVDTTLAYTPHEINHQIWLFEDGTIKFRVGKVDVGDSPYYDPERGFIRDNGEVDGPRLGIVNQTGFDSYILEGSFDEPRVIQTDSLPALLGLPDEGWTVTWKRKILDSTEELHYDNELPALLTSGIIAENHDMESWFISDLNGSRLKEGKVYDLVEVIDFPSGVYVLTWYDQKRIRSRKIVKI